MSFPFSGLRIIAETPAPIEVFLRVENGVGMPTRLAKAQSFLSLLQ
jgi:hypothetical protein